MSRDVTGLRKLAAEMFSPELAEAVNQQIDDGRAEDTPTLENYEDATGHTKGFGTGYRGDALYKKLGTGKFEGLPQVRWNGVDKLGTPTFIYTPDQANPFRYTTSEDRVIVPQIMDTDGGSIPRILHGFAKFSPWLYAPAYIIHDWLFVAHKTNTAPDNDITFQQSADIMVEAIKTMMESGIKDYDGNVQVFDKAEDTLYLMHKAVLSFVARKLWDDMASIIRRH